MNYVPMEFVIFAELDRWHIAVLVLACVFLLKLAKRKIGSAVAVGIAAIVVFAVFGPRDLARQQLTLQQEIASTNAAHARATADAARDRAWAEQAKAQAGHGRELTRQAQEIARRWTAEIGDEVKREIAHELTSDHDLREIVDKGRTLIAKLPSISAPTELDAQLEINVTAQDSNDASSPNTEMGDASMRGDAVDESSDPSGTTAEIELWDADEESWQSNTLATSASTDDSRPEWVDDIELNGYQWDDHVYRTRVMATSDNEEDLNSQLVEEIDKAIAAYSIWYRSMEGLNDPWFDRFPFKVDRPAIRRDAIKALFKTEKELEIGGEVWPVTYALLEFDGKFQRHVQAHFDQARSLARSAQVALGFGTLIGGVSLLFGGLKWSERIGTKWPIGPRGWVAGMVVLIAIVVAIASTLPAV